PRKTDCFYAPAENVVSAYAVGVQVGVRYKMGPYGVGFAFTTPQNFEDYEWNSFVALPYNTSANGTKTFNPLYGTARTVKHPLDGPKVISAGVSFEPNPKLRIGGDYRWIGYASVDGAGGPGGFKADHSLNGIGWKSISAGAVGFEYKAMPGVT